MSKATILYAENNSVVLKSIKEFLENNGFKVITAINPEEARTSLEEVHLDLALLDIRLRNDKDPDDKSGLWLARNVAPNVPKIILSNVKDWKVVREALRQIPGDSEGALDYFDKDDPPEELLKSVRRAIQYRIFIVHGHDDAAKLATVLFIKEIGLSPIVLGEQPGQGDTIIENLERYSNVSFAVVLLTPDDFGIAQRDPNPSTEPRARQNVIFELGYFIGQLGRKNVFALIKGDIEIPSDFEGILSTPMDEAGAWRIKLANELEGTGIYVDRTKIL